MATSAAPAITTVGQFHQQLQREGLLEWPASVDGGLPHTGARRDVLQTQVGESVLDEEVAALVAQGLSNAEIAERLTLTVGTVGNHVTQVCRMLGLRNRVQLAVWAAKQGLYWTCPPP